jgi:RNA polymerase sporulation-specific sigma factor
MNGPLDLTPCLFAGTTRFRYANHPDSEVLARAQAGCRDAQEHLLYKYRSLVRARVKSYFLVGAEREDLLQIGMIGLWQAVVEYRPGKASSFPAFAKVCIHRNIISAINTATRQKQLPLNNSLSFEVPSEEDGAAAAAGRCPRPGGDAPAAAQRL